MPSAMGRNAVHISSSSVRRMVRQLHGHSAQQRQTVMTCRNNAEALTAVGIAFNESQEKRSGSAVSSGPTGSAKEAAFVAAPSGTTATATAIAAADGKKKEATADRKTPVCFAEVASERDVKQNFILDNTLSGVAVAVSDALDLAEFRTRSGLDTPTFHHLERSEFPFISWLRRQGAQFVGKLSCRTPLALNEGCVFGSDKPAAVAVAARACHYAISCSLTCPPSLACCVAHDIVGFKPTSQTFGTFTKQYKFAIPSMTLGLSANRVDDLLYLWQMYTAAIEPERYFENVNKKPGEDGTAGGDASGETRGPSSNNSGDGDDNGDKSHHEGGGEGAGDGGAGVTHETTADILDHNPYNYTVKSRRGRMSDIDVGWRDYNTASAEAEGFDKQPKASLFQRFFSGERGRHVSPRVELAVGYPAEWVEKYCKERYGSPLNFHRRLTDSVYYRSALHKNQTMEIIPLAFDFEIEDVMHASNTISHYELARSFDTMLFSPSEAKLEAGTAAVAGGAPGGEGMPPSPPPRWKSSAKVPSTLAFDLKAPAAPNRPNTFKAMGGVLEELPEEVAKAIDYGQRLTAADYNGALRTRDDVVRAIEEQFQDVDTFVVPLLASPYETGDLRSVALTLPFHLAGNPILSAQMDKGLPVALVGELGRDAALLEDAFCFFQFVRGASPKWWRQKVFGSER